MITSEPAADGDLLEITVTVTRDAKPGDVLIVPFAMCTHDVVATDHLVCDVLTMPGSLQSGFFVSPLDYHRDTVVPVFRKRDGIDQFGREQTTGPPVRGGPGTWERRVVGLSTVAPHIQLQPAAVFRGGRPGTFTIRIDNVGIRHVDGSTSPIWTEDAHTQVRPIRDTAAFTDMRVRTVR